MSRTTHDFECSECGAKGKIVDDAIFCPKCGRSIEGQVITGDALEAMFAKFRLKDAERTQVPVVPTKQAKG